MVNIKSALDAWWMLAPEFGGGMLGWFLLGAFVEKVNRKGAILDLVLILWMSPPFFWNKGLMQTTASRFYAYLAILFGASVLFLPGFW